LATPQQARGAYSGQPTLWKAPLALLVAPAEAAALRALLDLRDAGQQLDAGRAGRLLGFSEEEALEQVAPELGQDL